MYYNRANLTMVLYKVGLLQATNIMQLCHGNDDDPRRGLLPMEQRPEFAVLRVRFVQGRGAGTHKKRLAQALSSQHCDAGLAHWHLLNWMLCFQKHKKIRNRLPIRRKPDVQSPTQMGFLLVCDIYPWSNPLSPAGPAQLTSLDSA